MAAGPMKLVWILGLLGIAAEKRVPSLLRASPDYAPTYDEKRVPPTPLEVLSEKTALDALKARSAAAAADGISQQIQTLTAAGHARGVSPRKKSTMRDIKGIQRYCRCPGCGL
ncbi:unnamed protein product [Durusdinium trenchii]|uniref:Uncharacterized protein n=1 Tax=Durusdinium trenchii TaxID=1381693 RepID=A0ABP0JA60_9DINO